MIIDQAPMHRFTTRPLTSPHTPEPRCLNDECGRYRDWFFTWDPNAFYRSVQAHKNLGYRISLELSGAFSRHYKSIIPLIYLNYGRIAGGGPYSKLNKTLFGYQAWYTKLKNHVFPSCMCKKTNVPQCKFFMVLSGMSSIHSTYFENGRLTSWWLGQW